MDQPVTLADDELWGAPAPTPTDEGGKTSHARRWIAAFAGTAAIVVAAVVGANLASSSTQGLASAGGGGAGGPGGSGGPVGFGGPGGPGGRGNTGTIARIDGSTIQLTTDAGATVSVVTVAATTVTVSSAGSLADVKVGDNVRVAGATSGATVAADQLTDSGANPPADVPGGGGRVGGPPPAGATPPAGAAGPGRNGGGPPVAGVVRTATGGTFTVTATDGSTLSVTITSATVVTLVKPSTLQALTVGDTIQVNGTTASDGTITATSIRRGVVTAGR